MKKDFTRQQLLALKEVVDNMTFRGKDAEFVIELRKTILENLGPEPIKPEPIKKKNKVAVL